MTEADDQLVEQIRQQYPSTGQHDADILQAVALWYNGAWFEVGDWWYNIGYQKPPSLQLLLDCDEATWNEDYAPALDGLQDLDLLEECYLLRRKCKWSPTRTGRKLIGDVFPAYVTLFTERKLNRGTGLVGDWEETLRHRTGVETVHTALRLKGWVPEIYPGTQGQTRPDIDAQDRSQALDLSDGSRWDVEVLTAHNDHALPERKYNAFADIRHRKSLWIFEDRKHAVQTLSRLHVSDKTACRLVNAPYQNPENYSITVANEYIERSKTSTDHSCHGIDEIGTITGWYERHFSEDVLEERLYKKSRTFECYKNCPPHTVATV